MIFDTSISSLDDMAAPLSLLQVYSIFTRSPCHAGKYCEEAWLKRALRAKPDVNGRNFNGFEYLGERLHLPRELTSSIRQSFLDPALYVLMIA